ncbi:MAG: hypothetical protein IIW53_04890, partial [Rikenellaceae bacterium]|nr:hypothetical protein [Rikenellaceae bacterium]
ILYIPDDENYEAMYEICAAVSMKQARTVKLSRENANLHELDAFFKANNKTVWKVREMREAIPRRSSDCCNWVARLPRSAVRNESVCRRLPLSIPSGRAC